MPEPIIDSVLQKVTAQDERIRQLEYVINLLHAASTSDLRQDIDDQVSAFQEHVRLANATVARVDDVEKKVRRLELRTDALEANASEAKGTIVTAEMRGTSDNLKCDSQRLPSKASGHSPTAWLSDAEPSDVMRGLVEQARSSAIENEKDRQRLNTLADNLEHQVDTKIEAMSAEIKRLRWKVETIEGLHVESIEPLRKKHSMKPVKKASLWDKVPNYFREVNESHDGFDPTHADLEKRFTVMTIFSILFIIVGMFIFYSGQTFSATAIMSTPSLQEYTDIAAQPNLIGDPICECQFSTMVFGGDTGFVSNVSFKLDGVCNPANVIAGGDPSYEQSGYEGDTGLVLRGCKYAEIQDLNPSLQGRAPSAGDGTSMLGPACAAVTEVFQYVMRSVDEACMSMDDIHKNVLRNFNTSLFVTDQLLSPDALMKVVQAKLHERAILAAESVRTSYHNAHLLLADKPLPPKDLIKEIEDFPLNFQIPCETFDIIDFGGDRQTAFVMPAILSCFQRGFWEGRCGGNTARFPCSPGMVRLGGMLNASEYSTLSGTLYGGMLEGLSQSSHAERVSALRGDPEGGRRLTSASETVNVGFTWTFQSDAVFSKYFHACQPFVCNYSFTRDPAAGILLALAGILGGTVTFIRNCCLGALICRKISAKGNQEP